MMVAIGLLSASGCALKQKKNAASKVEAPPRKPQIYWPGPPDEPRFKYEWRLKTIGDLQPLTEEQRTLDLLTGNTTGDKVVFTRPAGIAAAKGRIYVADTQGEGVVVFDVPRRRVFKFGHREPNELKKPVAVSVDGQGNVYVLDTKAKKIMVFDSLGLYLWEIADSKSFKQVAGLAVNQAGDRIYVVDRGTVEGDDHRVHVYDNKGNKRFEIGPRGGENGQLNIPLDATVDKQGNLYVVDSGNFRIQKFTADGKFLSTFGSVGRGFGQFSRARGIAVGPDGNIYVSDGVFNNVQIFSPEGQLLMPLGQYGIDQDLPGEYGLIAGVAVDETNRLYVVDQLFNKVEIFKRME